MAVHARLRGLPEPTLPEPDLDPIGAGSLELDQHPEAPRAVSLARPASEWLQEPDSEIHLGITEEQFLAEVSRCLSCGECFGCEQCWMYCAHTCFTRLENPKPGRYYALALENCQACGKCIDICPCGFLQVRSPEAPA
jgi:ferredoxin